MWKSPAERLTSALSGSRLSTAESARPRDCSPCACDHKFRSTSASMRSYAVRGQMYVSHRIQNRSVRQVAATEKKKKKTQK